MFIVFFACLTGYLYFKFVFDSQVSLYLQKTLSELNGAKVNIGKVQSQLLKGRFVFTDLQIGNPISPMRNTFEIARISADIAVAPLFRKKLTIKNMAIEEVRYWTPRQDPGTFSEEMSLAVVKAALLDRASSGIYSGIRNELTDNPLRHLGQLGSGFTLSSKLGTITDKLSSIQHLRNLLMTLRENEIFWEKQKMELPSAANLSGLKARLHSKEAKNAGHDLTPQAEMDQKLKETQENLSLLKKQIADLSSQLNFTDELIKKDIRTVRQELGLPNTNYSDITHLTFGPTWLSLIEKLSYWLEFSRSKSPVGQRFEKYAITVLSKKKSRSVHFGKMGALPTFLLNKASITSGRNKENKEGAVVRIEGSASGVTSDPVLYGKPAQFQLKADYPEKGFRDLELSGVIDHTQQVPKETFKILIPSFRLENWPVTRTPDVKLEIKKALASLTVDGTFEGDHVDLDWQIGLSETEYGIDSRFRQVELALENLLTNLYSFSVVGQLKGPLNDIHFTSSSEMGKRLAEGLKTEFRHEFGALDEAIETETKNLMPPLKNDIRARLHKLETETLPQFEQSLKNLHQLL